MKLIALCGAPKTGKSEVQRWLQEKHGVMPVDDGFPCREIAIQHFGLGHDCVYSQAGKARYTKIHGGRVVQNRVLLGEIGNMLETIGGPDFIPEAAIHRIRNVDCWAFCFGSVRRQQAAVYKRRGGLVVGITRPNCTIDNEFDDFDHDLVDVWIRNTGTAADLIELAGEAILPYLTS